MLERPRSERGIALLLALLVTMLMSALLIGFTASVATDQRYRFIDRDRTRAFYAAHSGLEKLNADLASLFFVKVAPTDAEIAGLSAGVPSIPDVTFATDGSGVAYGVTSLGPASSGQITTGPYQGLIALKKVYDLDASARTATGGEVHLRRKVETVAIPVFQFGFFSEVDLSFSAADDFDFGGRIHTNANLFLAQGGASGDTLWIRDRVTAVKEIIRQRLSNGNSIDASGSTRTVKVAKAPGSFRNLARTEGSVTDGVGSSANSSWPTLSLSTYNGYLRTGKTGARPLNLPLITTGGTNVDLVRRPGLNEDASNPTLYGERYFTKTSIRVLLSDTADDIMNLPGVTNVPPVELDGNWITTPPNNGTAYGPVSTSRPPIARSPGALSATLSGSVSSGTTASISLSGGVPAAFRLPSGGAVRVRRTNGTVWNATCTGKTQNTLTGCTPAPSPSAIPANGTMVEIDVPTAEGTTTISLPLFNAWQSPSTTINLGNSSSFPTAALTPNTFWVHNGNGTTTMVTCTGHSSTQLTGCNVDINLQNNATIGNAALTGAGVGTIGGFLKVELQDVDSVWHDVTMEILNWGIAGPNVEGKACADPTPNAILRFQRLRDNNERTSYGAACQYPITNASNQPLSTEYWPNVLFDAREGVYRETAPDDDDIKLGGVMHYVAIDVANLSKWFSGTAPYNDSTGRNAITNNGFSVYFSDRRNNRTAAGAETGEYGYEDFVNPASGTAQPNGVLNTGEDVNGDGELQTYGQYPSYKGNYNTVPDGAVAPFTTNARPWTGVRPSQARVNRAIFFRRAVKLINGGLGSIAMPGLTVASENPVYIQGDWNANQSGFGNPHAATSVVADAVTLLSNAWNDANSFNSPYATGGRPRSSHTYYRVAVISGKGPIFPNPSGTGATYGTDGGAHSFLRFLEGSSGSNLVHYRGSLVTFYFNRQAISPFKCCGGIVYDVPVRDYTFDTDFLDPAKLPPLTPVFRDLNALGFAQETRPGR
ncbi:MAG: hypothetical protein AB7J63_17595 [Vicinamibacterales bacterium]